ncbi:hypothetical protein CCGE525_10030 [Rhizobium jaguaris]|uniref:Uncharacterized protein n=1 Tax=Rhizobium jaguaris TaxID=1312183 RepID=A0A387FNL4_9HYPH|nr:hypothetical protein CCGE525_10030 [Rhizobium jaguaris]
MFRHTKASSEIGKLFSQLLGDFIGRVYEAVVFDGVHPDTALFQTTQMKTQKLFLCFAPFVKLGFLLHGVPQCRTKPDTEQMT